MSDNDGPVSSATKELVRLVELDYERTAKFIEGVIGTSAAIRGLLVTAWLAVVTLAVNTSRWALAAVSLAVVIVFGLVDAYHSWLYHQALQHAIELESISRTYYAALARGGDDPDAEEDLEVHLQAHRLGVYSNLRRFRMKDLRRKHRAWFAVHAFALGTDNPVWQESGAWPLQPGWGPVQ